MAIFGFIKRKNGQKPYSMARDLTKEEVSLSDQTLQASILFEDLISDGTFADLDDVYGYALNPDNFIGATERNRILKDLKSGHRASDANVPLSAATLRELGITKNNALHPVGISHLSDSDLVAAPAASFLLANFDKICEMYASDISPYATKRLTRMVELIRKNIQLSGSRKLAKMESNYANILPLAVVNSNYDSYQSVLEAACMSSPNTAVQTVNKILKNNQEIDSEFLSDFDAIIEGSTRWNALLEQVKNLYENTIENNATVKYLTAKNEKLTQTETSLTEKIDEQIVNVDLLMDINTSWIDDAQLLTNKNLVALSQKSQQKATNQLKNHARMKNVVESTKDGPDVHVQKSIYGKHTKEGVFTPDTLYRLMADEITSSGAGLESLLQDSKEGKNNANYILIQGNSSIKVKQKDAFEDVLAQEMLLTNEQLKFMDKAFTTLLTELPNNARKVNGVPQYNDPALIHFTREMQTHNPDIPFDFAHCSYDVKRELYNYILNMRQSGRSLLHKKAQEDVDQFFIDDLCNRKLLEHMDEVEAEVELEALRNGLKVVQQQKNENASDIEAAQSIIEINNTRATAGTSEMKAIQKEVVAHQEAASERMHANETSFSSFKPYAKTVADVVNRMGNEMRDSVVPTVISTGDSNNLENPYYNASILNCKVVPVVKIEGLAQVYYEDVSEVVYDQQSEMMSGINSTKKDCAAKLANILKFYGKENNNLVCQFVDKVNMMADAVQTLQQELDHRDRVNAPYARIVKDSEMQ